MTTPRPFHLVRALPLVERARAVVGRALPPALRPTPAVERSLARWREQSPFGDPRRFVERLASDGLSEPQFLRLLALADADIEPPAWARWWDDLPECAADRSPPRAPEVALLAPLLDRAAAQLRAALVATGEQSEAPTIDVAAALRSMVRALLQRLRRLVSPTLALELQVAELRGELPDERPDARRAEFAARLADPARARALWAEYPALARQVALVTEQWSAASLELLERLTADWEELRRLFGAPGDTGSLLEISLGRGDTHCGGRSVAVLTFSSGCRVVYKPRSLDVDARFGELLGWLAVRGAPRLRAPRTLARGTYGWAEFIEHAPCTSPAAIERFCERQGALLALLYALEATDCHAENVIACGEDPLLIDLETLLQPRVLAPRSGATGALDTSILRVGLVSTTMRDSAGVDYSGVGDLEPGRPARHRAHLGDAPVRAEDHADALARGFQAMTAVLIRERAALLAEDGPLARFADAPVRVVLRATDAYALLLRETLHPDCLRDALERDRAFDRLWLETHERPELARVIRHERDDLWREDVPYFSTTPGSRDLVTSRGERVEGFLGASAMTGVVQRLDALEEEAPRQIALLREALAAMAARRGETPPALPRRRSAAEHAHEPAPATPERLIAAATALAEQLRGRALEDRRQVVWLDVQRAPGGATLSPCGVDLYAGTAGIALFLAALARVTGAPRHHEFAERVSLGVLGALGDGAGLQTLGGFDGAGGVLYALAHLAGNRPGRRYRAAAGRLVDQIAGRCGSDDLLDVISGSAGAIGGLLAWARVDEGGSALTVAARCGEHLLARALELGEGRAWACSPERPPLAGYAHGAAGIGAMLDALGATLGEPRYLEAARAARSYERSLFDPDRRAWPDLEATGDRRFRNSWCRGAVGCGLARVQALHAGADRRAAEELADACAFARAATAGDDSLCHGTLGTLELLLQEAEWRGEASRWRELATRAGALLDAIDRRGPWCGNKRHHETPGLLTGLAGIGYGLLRLARPALVPSVLILAPPSRA